MTEQINAPTDQATAPATAPTHSSGGFSPDQLQQMATWEVEAGRLTREQADAMLKADGAEPAAKPGNLSPEAAEMDKAFPPAKATDFTMPPIIGPGETYKDVEALDQHVRGVLSEAMFTKEIGNALYKEAHKVYEQTKDMTDAQRELHARSERARLEKLWGKDTEAKLNCARQLVRELDERHPGLIEMLNLTGAGNSTFVIAQFYMQAERLEARRPR